MIWLTALDILLEVAQNFLCALFYALAAGLLAAWITHKILERHWKG